jgi:hypothetical protein
MTNRSATNSRNRSIPRRARPAAGAVSCRAGAGKPGLPRESPPRSAFFLPNPALPDIRCGRFQPVAERAARSAAIAQLVEHVIRNDGVTGSNPVCGTSLLLRETNFRNCAASCGPGEYAGDTTETEPYGAKPSRFCDLWTSLMQKHRRRRESVRLFSRTFTRHHRDLYR